MAWGTEQSATQLTTITTEQFFDSEPTTTVGSEVVDCQIEADFPLTPTDDLVVSLYGTTKTSPAASDWDVEPFAEYTLSSASDPNIMSFQVRGKYKFRVGVRRSGTTDTIDSADFRYRVG